MTDPRALKIVVVCMANVCRSPMAEAVIEGMAKASAATWLEVESAGVRVASPGVRPDARAEAALLRRGYAVRKGRSRQLIAADLDRFDLLLAMDNENLAQMQKLSTSRHQRDKLRLFLDFTPGLRGHEVPDPYFGNAVGFERVLDLCEAGARGLLATLRDRAAIRDPAAS